MVGHASGEEIFIPRIPIMPSDFIFQFKRIQFPICLYFATRINKAQGQSLKIVGLYLLKPCFSHGMPLFKSWKIRQSVHPSSKWKNNEYRLSPKLYNKTFLGRKDDICAVVIQVERMRRHAREKFGWWWDSILKLIFPL
ncbi:hypothetical protein AVEN_219129-1 [Araneus ventricosus]|uniref:ATP-dependent DNA helicase n=1 Tax=Araneus ventricosus TaxID=182803 RepID=A0A4Y2FMH4_ARAVE|nr:hypothetical protein AVEN_219129-1 [Araneus ventricosus]